MIALSSCLANRPAASAETPALSAHHTAPSFSRVDLNHRQVKLAELSRQSGPAQLLGDMMCTLSYGDSGFCRVAAGVWRTWAAGHRHFYG
jgi:hypothetical protein